MAGTFKARSQHPVGSLRTLSGLIMMVNFLILLMALATSITWRLKLIENADLKDRWLLHLIALALPTGGYLIIQLIVNCGPSCQNLRGLADIFMMLLCFVFAALIIASGVYLHVNIHDLACNQQRNCQQITTSVIIGYISAGFLFAESYFHLSEKNIVMQLV